MNYAEQIGAFEARRKTLVDANEAIMATAADEGATLDADQASQFDDNEADIAEVDKHLDRLRKMEKAAVAKAVPAAGGNAADASESRGGHRIEVKRTEKLAPGIGFARIAKVKALAKLDGESVRTVAKDLYGENSQTFGFFNKAAVSAMGSADGLVGDEGSAFADFLEYLRPMTILGQFGAGGVPSLRRVPFRVPLIGQTSGGEGYWVGEGKAKPLTGFDFTRTTLEPTKVANIAVATEEALRDSSPSAETILRDQLAAALAARLDIDFIDPAKAAVAGVSPASITNGVSFVASSGTDADAVRADVKALFGAFIAANNAPTSGVWIMPATVALSLSMMQNPLGQNEFAGITMNGGTFQGLPVIVSQYVNTAYDPDGAGAGTSGAIVVLANASDIYLADEGGIAVDMSREASLEMNDAPTGDSLAPTAASLVSMFQTNSVAFRAERTVNWAKRRPSAVAALGSVAWA